MPIESRLFPLTQTEKVLLRTIKKQSPDRTQSAVTASFAHAMDVHKIESINYASIKRVYLEELKSKSEALKRERQIKGWGREKKIRVLKIII